MFNLADHQLGELEGWCLVGGRYRAMVPDAAGRLRSDQLDLSLGVVDRELRFFDPDGRLVQKPEETAEHEHRRAEEERRRADAAEAELRALVGKP